MKCCTCGAQMETRREDYLYTASGLSAVTLQQVEVSRCPSCGESKVALPQIEALHQAIAAMLVRKRARLAPEEIRYLRTYLGWSGVACASRMGVTPEELSRWEHGKTVMGKVADRLLRTLVVIEMPVPEYATAALTAIADASHAQPLQLVVRVEQDAWQVAPWPGADALLGVPVPAAVSEEAR